MNKNLIFKAFAIYAGATLLAACQPKNTGAATVSSSLTMTGSSKARTVAKNEGGIWNLLINTAHAFISPSLVDKNGSAVSLTNAWVAIKEVEFESTETADVSEVDGTEISFQGPYFVDLLSNSPTAMDTQQIPASDIRRIKMKLHAASGSLPGGVPPELNNNSVFFSGTVGGNNFTFQLDDSTEVNIGGPNPVVPKDGGSMLVEVNLGNVIREMDLSTVTNNEVIDHNNRHAGANLCPNVDASANDLYTCLRKALEKEADVGEDSDGNHDLDANEDCD